MLDSVASITDLPEQNGTAGAPRQLPVIAASLMAVPYLIEAGKLDQALACVQDALGVNPQSAAAHCEMAALTLTFRDLDQTLALLTEAERLDDGAAQARIALLRADAAFIAGKMRESEAGYAEIIAARENAADAWVARAMLGLGRIHIQREEGQAAAAVLAEAARLDPNSFLIKQVLARALEAAGDRPGALAAFQAAMRIKEDDPGLLNDLGALLSRMKRLEEAAQALSIAVRLQPNFPMAHNNLGLTFYQMRRLEDAAVAFENCLKHDPSNAFAQHMAAAVRGDGVPDRASDDYVKITFDQFAADFETKLARLEYRAPELLTQAIANHLGAPAGALSVLDAGCGTGLCGPLLRPYAASLVGVDLSGGMLKKAEGRAIYDRLVMGEITAFTEGHPHAYNLIVAADVLCYFGDIGAFCKAAARALKPGGTLAFTVEQFADGTAPFKLNAHGRYSHSESYIHAVAHAAGLTLGPLSREILRREGNDPVFGFVVLLDKPAACRGAPERG